MKSNRSRNGRSIARVRALAVEAAHAEQRLHAARNLAHIAKREFKEARKTLKLAKKAAKRARKTAETAAKSLKTLRGKDPKRVRQRAKARAPR